MDYSLPRGGNFLSAIRKDKRYAPERRRNPQRRLRVKNKIQKSQPDHKSDNRRVLIGVAHNEKNILKQSVYKGGNRG